MPVRTQQIRAFVTLLSEVMNGWVGFIICVLIDPDPSQSVDLRQFGYWFSSCEAYPLARLYAVGCSCLLEGRVAAGCVYLNCEWVFGGSWVLMGGCYYHCLDRRHQARKETQGMRQSRHRHPLACGESIGSLQAECSWFRSLQFRFE